jgi:hypothetical protein
VLWTSRRGRRVTIVVITIVVVIIIVIILVVLIIVRPSSYERALPSTLAKLRPPRWGPPGRPQPSSHH